MVYELYLNKAGIKNKTKHRDCWISLSLYWIGVEAQELLTTNSQHWKRGMSLGGLSGSGVILQVMNRHRWLGFREVDGWQWWGPR